jgi:opacity protein-like surface antigen
MRYALTTAASAALALLTLAGPAQGQLRVIPQVGLYAPVTDLSPGFGDAVDIGKQESTLALGAALDFRGDASLGFRLGGMYATASDVPIDGVGCADCEARNTVLALTGAAVFRPTPMLAILRPYLLAGAGGKWYNFSFPSGEGELEEVLEDTTQLAFQLGAGVEFDLRVIRMNVELSDYISSYEAPDRASERQHDMVFSVGLILGGR